MAERIKFRGGKTGGEPLTPPYMGTLAKGTDGNMYMGTAQGWMLYSEAVKPAAPAATTNKTPTYTGFTGTEPVAGRGYSTAGTVPARAHPGLLPARGTPAAGKTPSGKVRVINGVAYILYTDGTVGPVYESTTTPAAPLAPNMASGYSASGYYQGVTPRNPAGGINYAWTPEQAKAAAAGEPLSGYNRFGSPSGTPAPLVASGGRAGRGMGYGSEVLGKRVPEGTPGAQQTTVRGVTYWYLPGHQGPGRRNPKFPGGPTRNMNPTTTPQGAGLSSTARSGQVLFRP